MLTTGEVSAFRATAVRLFGEDFGAVEAIVVHADRTPVGGGT
jgi:hypothetical protein